MVDNLTPQSAPPAAPQDATQNLRAQRQRLEAQYPPPIIDTLRTEDVLALPAEALVVIAGGPNCDIRGANMVKKIPNNAAGMGFVVNVMPQLVDRATGGWSTNLDADCDGQVEHHEIQAALIRGAQIAHQRGIPLGEVPIADMKREEIAPIANRISGHAAETCIPPLRTPAPSQTTEQNQRR